jgi:hypothetical protein
VDPKDGAFVYCDDGNLTQAKTKIETGSFATKNANKAIVLVCVLGCEQKHNKVYTKKVEEKGEEKGEAVGKAVKFTLASSWRNAARRTKPNMKTQSKKLGNALSAIEQRLQRTGQQDKAVDLRKVFELCQHDNARLAADWSTELSMSVSLLYGCTSCSAYPLRSSSWFRCNAKTDPFTGAVSKGHWRCACCLTRFEGFDGSKKRLLAIGDEKNYAYFFMGTTDSTIENKLRFLQLCSLVKELDGKPGTNENLIQAIVSIGDRTTRRLSKFKECKWCVAKDPSVFN